MSEEFFEQFNWALPLAFADPLGSCRFEEGDLLYDSKVAYQKQWGEAVALLKYSIQIKSPPRGPRTKVEQNTRSVFDDNWVQQVVLDFTEYPSCELRTITTTQGRLYSFLRFGDLGQLEVDSSEPIMPKLAQELMSKLGSLTETIVGRTKTKLMFVMPFDQTSAILKDKRAKIERSLGEKLRFEVQRFELDEIDPNLSSAYTATSELLCFKIKAGGNEEVNDALKKALYTPARDKITDAERFNLNKHGVLVSA